MKNVISRAIDRVFARVRHAGGPLEHAEQLGLYVAMIALRGGKALEADVLADMAAWVEEHGEPTRAKLDRWAAGLGVEAGVAAAALKGFHGAAS